MRNMERAEVTLQCFRRYDESCNLFKSTVCGHYRRDSQEEYQEWLKGQRVGKSLHGHLFGLKLWIIAVNPLRHRCGRWVDKFRLENCMCQLLTKCSHGGVQQ